MTFPPSFLDELRARLPLSELIGKRMRLVRAGREFKGCCPFHKEKTPSFTVNDEKQFYHCFGCGAHGDAIGFVMQHDNLSFPEAIETLAAQAGLPVPQDTPEERQKFDREKHLFQLLDRATVFFEQQLRAPAGHEAFGYLQRRSLSDEAMSRFRLGFAPSDAQALIRKLQGENFSLDDMLAVGLIKKSENRPDHYSFFRNRVIFPVGDRRGRIVAFGGRILGDGEPKYLNSPDHVLFHKGQLLYGLSRARTALSQGQPLLIVEGYMDVIALVEAGFMGAVAPLGTAMTEAQLALLWKILPNVDNRDPARDYSPILCFDGDRAGVSAAARAAERTLPLLTPAQTIRIAYLPKNEDPDSLLQSGGPSAMQNVLAHAKPMVDILWDLSLEGRQLRTPEERAAFQRAVRQKVGQIRDEELRGLYKSEIEKRLSSFFQWNAPPKNSFIKGKKGNSPFSGNRYAAPHTLPRHQPLDGQKLRERVLLALMVNHPALFTDFGEDLCRIAFKDGGYDALRQQIVTFFETDSHETLDVETLYRHLSLLEDEGAAQTSVRELLSEGTYVHAGFARPDRPLEQARLGWKSIWNKYLQEQLQTDLQAAGRLWREDPSDANLRRLMALREQIESLARESVEQESGDGEDAFA